MSLKKDIHCDMEILDDLELAHWIAKNLPIRFIGDDVLKQKCVPYSEEEFGSNDMIELSSLLIDTLKKYREKTGLGKGLAANQIGISKRMIVIWLEETPMVLINPEIINTEGKGSYWECCISSGTLVIGEAIRPWKGMFKYRDIQGDTHTIEADEKQTRILLHEIEHLEGHNCFETYNPETIKFIHNGKEEITSYSLIKK